MRHRYVANDLNILNINSMRGNQLKYLRHGFTMLEMTEEFDKGLINVGNDVYIWKLVYVFEKRLKHVGNDLHLWEMAQICGEMA